MQEAVVCWGRVPEVFSGSTAGKAAAVAGGAEQVHVPVPTRPFWCERGITLSGVRVVTRASGVTTPGTGGGTASITCW